MKALGQARHPPNTNLHSTLPTGKSQRQMDGSGYRVIMLVLDLKQMTSPCQTLWWLPSSHRHNDLQAPHIQRTSLHLPPLPPLSFLFPRKFTNESSELLLLSNESLQRKGKSQIFGKSWARWLECSLLNLLFLLTSSSCLFGHCLLGDS